MHRQRPADKSRWFPAPNIDEILFKKLLLMTILILGLFSVEKEEINDQLSNIQ